jgi:hypothetical protein
MATRRQGMTRAPRPAPRPARGRPPARLGGPLPTSDARRVRQVGPRGGRDDRPGPERGVSGGRGGRYRPALGPAPRRTVDNAWLPRQGSGGCPGGTETIFPKAKRHRPLGPEIRFRGGMARQGVWREENFGQCLGRGELANSRRSRAQTRNSHALPDTGRVRQPGATAWRTHHGLSRPAASRNGRMNSCP